MIRQRWKIDTKVLDDLAAFAGDFTRMSADIGERAYRRIGDDLLDELQYYPAPRPNQQYQRTMRLKNGWDVGFERSNDGFGVEIENDTPYAKFVVGSLAQSIATAASFQAWMHKGRWPLATETILFFYEAFLEVYQDEFARELAQFGTTSTSRRAFTR